MAMVLPGLVWGEAPAALVVVQRHGALHALHGEKALGKRMIERLVEDDYQQATGARLGRCDAPARRLNRGTIRHTY